MTAGLSAGGFDYRHSSLYKDFLEEREEILRNKWYMSERAGQDVGFERALMDWVMNYRNGWRTGKK